MHLDEIWTELDQPFMRYERLKLEDPNVEVDF